MAIKTFNPNRTTGGTFTIVRATDGTYSLQETGFDAITSLNMADLGAVASVTPPKTIGPVPVDPADELKNQTKAAFLLPNQDRGDDSFTTEKMLKSATDVSKGLSEFETVSDRQKQESQLSLGKGVTGIEGPPSQISGPQIESPTERVFRDESNLSGYGAQTNQLINLETPQQKLEKEYTITAEKIGEQVQKFKSLTDRVIDSFKGPEKGTSVNVDKGRGSELSNRYRSEVAQGGMPGMLGDTGGSMNRMGSTMPANLGDTGGSMNRMSGTMPGMLDPTGQMGARNTLGISALPGGMPGDIEKRQSLQLQLPAKKTFASSVSTALKGVGEAVQKISPIMGVVQALGKQRNESTGAIALNRSKFNIVTSSGPMQGRIVGTKEDPNLYDPANNLFHGMNRDSAFGNLEKAGQKRIDTINKTLERQKNRPGGPSKVLIARKEKFEKELTQHKKDLREAPVKGTTKPGQSGGTEAKGSTKIVCTMMNESYGFGSFRNKIWMKFHKDLSPEYQRGYHKLFLPLVKIAKTNKIIKNILEHIAVHSTIDMRQSMKGKKHLLGRIYRKILLPICYWAGKK